MSKPLDQLRNLGPKSAKLLADCGIHNETELREIGVVGAFLAALEREPKTTRNLLWSLYAALEDRDWRTVPQAKKDALVEHLEVISGRDVRG